MPTVWTTSSTVTMAESAADSEKAVSVKVSAPGMEVVVAGGGEATAVGGSEATAVGGGEATVVGGSKATVAGGGGVETADTVSPAVAVRFCHPAIWLASASVPATRASSAVDHASM